MRLCDPIWLLPFFAMTLFSFTCPSRFLILLLLSLPYTRPSVYTNVSESYTSARYLEEVRFLLREIALFRSQCRLDWLRETE